MQWIAFKEDIAASLKAAAKPKTIILHPMAIDLVVKIDDQAQKQIAKDNAFLQKLRKQCELAADKSVHEMEAILKKADGQVAGFPEDMIGLFLRPVHVALEHSFDRACKSIGSGAAKLLDDYRKANDSLKKVSIKVDVNTKFEGIEVPGKKRPAGAAIKLAPIEMGDTLGEAQKELGGLIGDTIRLKSLGLGVQRALDQLEKNKQETGAPPDDKAGEEVNRSIALHQAQVVKLGKEWILLSKTFKGAETENDAWQKKFNASKAKLSPEKVKQIVAQMKKAEAAIDTVLRATVRVSSALKALEPGEAKFKAALEMVVAGKSGWKGEVQAAMGLGDLFSKAAMDLEKVVQERSHAVAEAEKAIEKQAKA